MNFDFLPKPLRSKIFKWLVLIYGLVFFNIGALVLYEKFTRPPVAFDSTLRWGVASLLLGLVALIAAHRINQKTR